MQGYGPAWRRLRTRVLIEEPVCRGYLGECDKPSMEADHIVPLSQGGQSVRENAQGLCLSCHHRKTVDQGRGSKNVYANAIRVRLLSGNACDREIRNGGGRLFRGVPA